MKNTYVKTSDGIVLKIIEDKRNRDGYGLVLARPAYKTDTLLLGASVVTDTPDPHKLTTRQKIGSRILTLGFSALGVFGGYDLASTYHVPAVAAACLALISTLVALGGMLLLCGLSHN